MTTPTPAASQRPPVLISGAGPTGLLMSHWLHRYGVPHRIIDKSAGPGLTSRAIVMHARTIEFYRMLGIVDDILSRGAKFEKLCITHAGQLKGGLEFADAGLGQSYYPFVLTVTQDEHEEVLDRKLTEMGQTVERGMEVAGLEAPAPGADGDVTVRIKSVATGQEETMTASYVLGCDGAHSGVRHATGISMEGGTYGRTFFVADVYYSGAMHRQGQLHVCFTKTEFMILLPLPHQENRARIIGFVPEDKENDTSQITFDDCRPTVTQCAPAITVDEVRWFAAYKVHHRTADHFHYGSRVFLAGDACHLHSPVGGQGMNTGLGDATNLAWKIATAWHAGTENAAVGERLLDTYEKERMPFAKQLVNTTDTVFQLVIRRDLRGWIMRNLLMPYVMPFFARFSRFASLMYRTVSQTGIQYAPSPLSESGNSLAGFRVPWIEHAGGDAGDADNHAVLDGRGWQAHVWGAVSEELEQALWKRKVAVKKFPFTQEAGTKGFVENTVYVVRPDGYIGLAIPKSLSAKDAEKALESYADKWGVGILASK